MYGQEDSFTPNRHYAIHGHQDSELAAATVYDSIASNHQDTATPAAQYDVIGHHKKTAPPIPLLDTVCYDTITRVPTHQNAFPPACYATIAPSPPTHPDSSLSACYDVIKVPASPTSGGMDAAMEGGAYAIPAELDRNVRKLLFERPAGSCQGAWDCG